MEDKEPVRCLGCGGQLFVYASDEIIGLHFTYCDYDKCPRYKLVTLQEDV